MVGEVGWGLSSDQTSLREIQKERFQAGAWGWLSTGNDSFRRLASLPPSFSHLERPRKVFLAETVERCFIVIVCPRYWKISFQGRKSPSKSLASKVINEVRSLSKTSALDGKASRAFIGFDN